MDDTEFYMWVCLWVAIFIIAFLLLRVFFCCIGRSISA